MKCPCNCHDEQFRKDVGIEEHSDCGICFIALFEEEQKFNEFNPINSIGEYYFSHIKNRIGLR